MHTLDRVAYLIDLPVSLLLAFMSYGFRYYLILDADYLTYPGISDGNLLLCYM